MEFSRSEKAAMGSHAAMLGAAVGGIMGTLEKGRFNSVPI